MVTSSYISDNLTVCCILEVVLAECFLHIVNLLLARLWNAYSFACDILQKPLVKSCLFMVQAIYKPK